MLHLKDLCCFISVYDLHSFSRAAEALGMAQSLVSTRIQRLEQFIGAPLFSRSPRGVLPTKKGELLYQYAKRICHDVTELKVTVKLDSAA